MTEPTITINGKSLTEAQAMTVRVALCDFMAGLDDPDRYGRADDAPINDAYRDRLREIMMVML